MNRNDFFSGMRKGMPIFVGYFSASIAFGLMCPSAGMRAFEAVLFSALNFTGAAQFMAVNLLISGAAAGEIIVSFFLVNLRYFLMSASLNVRHKAPNHFRRGVMSFGVTDEVFSVAMGEGRDFSSSFLFGLELTAWLGWVSGTFLGYTSGMILPESLQAAAGISLYGLFAALLVPEVKRNWKALALALSAGGINTILILLFGVSEGWGMVVSMLATTAVAAALWKEPLNE